MADGWDLPCPIGMRVVERIRLRPTRGYSEVKDPAGHVVKSAADAPPASSLGVRLWKGRVTGAQGITV